MLDRIRAKKWWRVVIGLLLIANLGFGVLTSIRQGNETEARVEAIEEVRVTGINRTDEICDAVTNISTTLGDLLLYLGNPGAPIVNQDLAARFRESTAQLQSFNADCNLAEDLP